MKEIDSWLAGIGEGCVGRSEDGERRRLGNDAVGGEVEGEGHGFVAGIGEDLGGVGDGLEGEGGGESEEREKKDERGEE